jgi:AraC-like DNA-binding protein
LEITACDILRGKSDVISFDAPDYIFVYVRSGSGELVVSNRTHNLTAGDFSVCRPGEAKFFAPDPTDLAEFYWVAFSGRYATDLLSSLKLTSRDKYFIGMENEIASILDKVIEEEKSDDAAFSVIGSSLFVAALGYMSRLAIHTMPRDHTKGYEKIAPALNSITSDCTSKIGVDEYAKMCNLSTSYFTHLFTAVTGFSPMEYKQLQRINIAKNLLSTTNLSIKEISTVIGFKDPLYFGRCFKQATGQTPSGYRLRK